MKKSEAVRKKDNLGFVVNIGRKVKVQYIVKAFQSRLQDACTRDK